MDKYFINYFDSQKFTKIVDLCKLLTKDFDESHDINHHISVLNNAFDICKPFFVVKHIDINDKKIIIELLVYSCLLHDTIDHKYNNQENRKILEDFLIKETKFYKEVLWIIDNISYTKEVKYGYPVHDNNLVQYARDICSDADKLEAIGDIGLQRCWIYNKKLYPNLSDDEIREKIKEHCYDKLLKLKDNYIRTQYARELAEERHKKILQFISS